MTLAVDGNGTFSRDTALSTMPRRLPAIRSPGSRSRCIRSTTSCTAISPDAAPRRSRPARNLFSADDARNLLRHGGLRPDRDILQFDVSLSYGIVEYRRILDVMSAAWLERARDARRMPDICSRCNVVAGLGLGLAETAMDEDELFGTRDVGVRGRGRRARTLAGCAGHRLRGFRPARYFAQTDSDGCSLQNRLIGTGSVSESRDRVSMSRRTTRHATSRATTSAALVRPDHVHRRAYADPEIFELEQERIFGRLWIYVAHESQLKKPGDFVRTRLGRVRGAGHAPPRRPHLRAAQPLPASRRAAVHGRPGHQPLLFSCPYHAWVFRPDGSLASVPHPQELSGEFRHRRSAEPHAADRQCRRAIAASCSPICPTIRRR